MNNIINNFNRAAIYYDQWSNIQKYAGQCLINFLTQNQLNHSHGVDLGCGTGWTTQILSTQINFHTLYGIDVSEASLLLAQKKMSKNNIQFYCMNFNCLIFPHHYFNLMFSNLSLHWSNNFEKTIAYLFDYLKKDGILAFSIPIQGTLLELSGSLNAFSFYSKYQVIQLLKNHSYNIVHVYHHTLIEKFPNKFSALKSIIYTGTQGEKKQKTPCFHGNFDYLSHKSQKSKHSHPFYLTYNILYCIVRK